VVIPGRIRTEITAFPQSSEIPAVTRARRELLISKYYLLKLNLRADFFQLGLELAGLVLIDAFLD